MTALLRPALALVGLMTALLGLAVPLVFTGFAQVTLPAAANGSLLRAGGTPVGSILIGQDFTQDRYFHPRPSATTTPDPATPGLSRPLPYNAAASGGSNLAPSSATLLEAIQARIVGAAPHPADAATTSGSGLDPHISPANALRQASRIAAARNLPTDQVLRLVADHVEGRELGILGEPRVNVLRLNMALDALR
jgi:K+-transporting ATPase ATPase C chain